MYALLKAVHLAAIVTSGTLFQVRAAWMASGSPRLHARWVRILPHVVDTVLLASGIGLATLLAQVPFVHAWLTAKVLALVLYVILGSIALKRGRTRRVRLAAWVAATATFAYIVAVALGKSPWPVG